MRAYQAVVVAVVLASCGRIASLGSGKNDGQLVNSQCTVANDCVTIDVCQLCADGSCAHADCVNHTCGLTCSPTSSPGQGPDACQTDADCPAVGACPACANGNCASLACVAGACQFVCS